MGNPIFRMITRMVMAYGVSYAIKGFTSWYRNRNAQKQVADNSTSARVSGGPDDRS